MISSFAFATISPVSLLTRLFASVRPRRKSGSTESFFIPAASISRMCFTVMRLSFWTIALPVLVTMSNLAISPFMRSGTTSNSMPFLPKWNVSNGEELGEDALGVVPQRLQQDRDRHLAAAVDAEVQVVLRVELEVEPRAAVGDHAGREEELARGVRLAAVVLEEHAGRAVQLADDHALGAVHDEGAVARHERDLAHVDLLLLHFLDRRLAWPRGP